MFYTSVQLLLTKEYCRICKILYSLFFLESDGKGEAVSNIFLHFGGK